VYRPEDSIIAQVFHLRTRVLHHAREPPSKFMDPGLLAELERFYREQLRPNPQGRGARLPRHNHIRWRQPTRNHDHIALKRKLRDLWNQAGAAQEACSDIESALR